MQDDILKNKFEEYLSITFPKSDLSAHFGQIECEIHFYINTISNAEIRSIPVLGQAHIAIDVFNSIFNSENESIWILINEWDVYGPDYTIDQFSNLNENCISWCSYDTEDILREQVFLIKNKLEINYKNLFKALTNFSERIEPGINSRIYFINLVTNIIFMFWDDCIYVGSKTANQIKPIYDKYYDYVSKYSRTEFEKHLQ